MFKNHSASNKPESGQENAVVFCFYLKQVTAYGESPRVWPHQAKRSRDVQEELVLGSVPENANITLELATFHKLSAILTLSLS